MVQECMIVMIVKKALEQGFICLKKRNKMIIFFSDGRLGNQLFQYAFLNTIKKENEKIITSNMEQFVDKFDINNISFKHIVMGKYSRFITSKFLKPFLIFLANSKLIGYIKQDINDTSALPTYTEQKGILSLRLVETNFFQSENFFNPEKIDFKLKANDLDKANKILESIPNDNRKVFVHVRRGDYIFEKYLDKQGIDLPKQYFLDAIEKIRLEVKNPFFVFLSDDAGFVECCYEDIKTKYISKNSMTVDLALMSLCEYGIVSNSSFSWWGAYMMHDRKKVIFPKYWYGWKSKVESHLDIQPRWAEVIEVEKLKRDAIKTKEEESS